MPRYPNDRERIEAIATDLVDSALRVHRELGPGLLESVYQRCFAHELRGRGHYVEAGVELPLQYGGDVIEGAYRIDMLVDREVVVENKSAQTILPVHEAQLLTYLKLSDRRLGFLINWNVALIRNGIRRIANKL